MTGVYLILLLLLLINECLLCTLLSHICLQLCKSCFLFFFSKRGNFLCGFTELIVIRLLRVELCLCLTSELFPTYITDQRFSYFASPQRLGFEGRIVLISRCLIINFSLQLLVRQVLF